MKRVLAVTLGALCSVGLWSVDLESAQTKTMKEKGPARAALRRTCRADRFYVHQGRRVTLRRSSTEIGVRFTSGMSEADQIQAARIGIPDAALSSAGASQSRRVMIARMPESLVSKFDTDEERCGAVDDAVARLRRHSRVEYAYSTMVNPETGSTVVLTDRVAVKVRSAEDVDALAAVWNLRIVRKQWGTENEFVLRLKDPKAVDPLDVANAIAESGLVEWAQPDFVQQYRFRMTPNDPRFPDQWHLDNTGQVPGVVDADVDAVEAWDTTTGSSSVTIAILDNGVETTHEDLAPNIFTNPGETPNDHVDNDGNGYVDDVNGWDFYGDDNNPNPAGSNDNHGTAVAGVAAGRGNNARGVTGVCQNCRILPVKIASGDTGFVSDAEIADAIRYAASLADVINNSWSGSLPSAAIQSAIQWANVNGRGGRGSSVVCAAGNSASGYELYGLNGVPAGTHRFRWEYLKNRSGSAGDDTVWIAWIYWPDGAVTDFNSGWPANSFQGGNSPFVLVSDPTHADEGMGWLQAAKAGTIGNNQSSWLDIVRTVPSGTVYFFAWLSSQANADGFRIRVDLDNDGGGSSWDFTGSLWSGQPDPTPRINAVGYPAGHPESIAVGATTSFDYRSFYSQFGAALDVVAPSSGSLTTGITTTDRTGSAGYDASSYTPDFGGTSSATPLTAGVIGLMLSANPTLSRDEVYEILTSTTDQTGPEPYVNGRNDRYGFGRVNAAAAVDDAGSCSYSINPTNASYGSSGGSGTVSVTAGAGCAWIASSNNAWITVTSGSSGSGNGSVAYNVAPNTGAARSGTITIAGLTFTVTQSSSCSYSIRPTRASFRASGGSGTVSVTAGTGCAWTASSNNAWITVTSGSSGSGNGSVAYSVAPNTGAARSGTITIAGRTFRVSQRRSR